jgi:creatinine deaminase
MCAGAIAQFGIKMVVVGVAKAKDFDGARSFLEDCGVHVALLEMDECKEMLDKYIKSNPTIWDEDIGRS